MAARRACGGSPTRGARGRLVRARRRRPDDRGAAAVEFALVVPLLVALLLGIIDYGLWFSDSLSLRQGVREAARQGVVANFGDAPCPVGQWEDGLGSANVRQLACSTIASTGAVTGPMWVRILVPAEDESGTGWASGRPLLVCGAVRADGLTGFTPFPEDGFIRYRLLMTIEQETGAAEERATFQPRVAGPSPDWGWCS